MTKLSLIRNFRKSKEILYIKFYNLYCIQQLLKNSDYLIITAHLLLIVNCVSNTFYDLTSYLLIALYWVTLGVFSSIGFGTGLQTGMLFVIPKIISIYNNNLYENENDNHICLTNHSIYSNTSDNHSIYDNITNDCDYNLIIKVYIKCIPFVFLWGLGTALGELPPYLIAYNIDIKDKLKTNNLYNMFGSNKEKIKEYVDWSIGKLKKNSFITIVILSSWPNAFFDMCGIASGFVKLSLLEFLIPTIIGKAFIKINAQLILILVSLSIYGNTFENDTQQQHIHFYIWLCWLSVQSTFTMFCIKEALENIVNS